MIALRATILALSLAAIAACDDDDDDPVQPRTLSCEATLEPVEGVTTDATGTATFDVTGTTMVWEVISTGLVDVTAAHIHEADESLLVPAVGSFPLSETGSGEGTMTVTEDQLDLIEAGGTYFDIHTEANEDGEIAGDLICD